MNRLLPSVRLNGADLFVLHEDRERPGAYPGATISIRYAPSTGARAVWGETHHSGPGVYGCFWKGELFYIGTYAGERGDLEDGNVAGQRWWKHIEGMTFRSRKIGIAASRLRWIEERHDTPLARLLSSGDRSRLTKKHGNGIQVQYSKFLFADRHWSDFSALDQDMMSLFDFVYVRPDPETAFVGLDKSSVDPHLRAVERRVVEDLAPVCNAATRLEEQKEMHGAGHVVATIERRMTEQADGHAEGHTDYQLLPRRKHR